MAIQVTFLTSRKIMAGSTVYGGVLEKDAGMTLAEDPAQVQVLGSIQVGGGSESVKVVAQASPDAANWYTVPYLNTSTALGELTNGRSFTATWNGCVGVLPTYWRYVRVGAQNAGASSCVVSLLGSAR
jgi:hypothetical protein